LKFGIKQKARINMAVMRRVKPREVFMGRLTHVGHLLEVGR